MPILFSKKSATIREVRIVLEEAKKRFPVMHLSPYDKIINGDNRYIMSRQIDGSYSLRPNITKQGLLFRGDSQYHQPFYSKSSQVKLAKTDVLAAFSHLIESFPLYRMFKEGVMLPDGKMLRFENPYAIAYLYGLKTPYIGLSSDLDVASFYAVTRWDYEDKRFVPVSQGEGILYAYELRQPLNQTRSLNTLGLQVYKRTYYQKAFVLQLHESGDFNKLNAVTGFRFNHDEEYAKDIFDKFEGGELLMPKDDLLSRKLDGYWQEKPEFTRDELYDVYSNITDYWKNFIDMIGFAPEEEDYRNALLQLPQNELYAKFFDLNRYDDEK